MSGCHYASYCWQNVLKRQSFSTETGTLSKPGALLEVSMWHVNDLQGSSCYSTVVSKMKHLKKKTEARSTQISKTKHLSKTKHPNLKNKAPKNSKTKTPKLETGLSFINTRQCLANTAGIKHDNEQNAVKIYSSRTARCCKCISAAAWEAMQFGRDQKTENAQTICRMLLYCQ